MDWVTAQQVRWTLGLFVGAALGGALGVTIRSVKAVSAPKAEAVEMDLPPQPAPSDVRVYQMIRWHDCQAGVVCYSYNWGPMSCVPGTENPWLLGECQGGDSDLSPNNTTLNP